MLVHVFRIHFYWISYYQSIMFIGSKSLSLTEKPFKTSFNSHTQSMRNAKYKNSTSLSTYVWSLKDDGIIPALKWSIVNTARTYTNGSRNCPLCLQEKYGILFYANKGELLNKRSELMLPFKQIFAS